MSRTAVLIGMVILFTSGGNQLWAKSGGGIGTPSTPKDWQLGDIELRVRRVVQPARRPLGLDYSQLKERFANKSFSIVLTVKPDGLIADVQVHRTSGSEEIDKKAVALIREAAPFHPARGGISTNETYFVVFPLLTVKPIDQRA